MDIYEALQHYDLYDNEIQNHGFTPYMRDYEITTVVYGSSCSSATIRLLFKGCVEVNYTSTIPPMAFSMDERLLSLSNNVEADGFAWGVNHASVEAWEYLGDSPRVQYWTNHFGLPMHECRFITNVFSLVLIFYNLEIMPVDRE